MIDFQRMIFILNPKASQSQKRDWKTILANFFFRHDVHFYDPNSTEEMVQIIENECKNNPLFIGVLGGDGTLHYALPELIKTETPLLIIPTGTANDLANELNVKANPDKIYEIIQYNSKKKIDVFTVNDHPIATIGGIGAAEKISTSINQLREQSNVFASVMKHSKQLTYVMGLIKFVLNNPVEYHQLELSSSDWTKTMGEGYIKKVISPLLMVCNQSKLGNSFMLSPQALNNDGLFDILLFTHQSKLPFSQTLLKVLLGQNIEKDQNIHRFQLSQLTIKSLSGEIPFFGDGELVGLSDKYNIKIIPSSLNVYTRSKSQTYTSSYGLHEVSL